MGDAPQQRVSRKFQKYLVDKYGRDLLRFSYPKATEMLLNDIEIMKRNMEKMMKKKKI